MGRYLAREWQVNALDHTCRTQCDRCHTPDKCVEATRQWRELLLCAGCYAVVSEPPPTVRAMLDYLYSGDADDLG